MTVFTDVSFKTVVGEGIPLAAEKCFATGPIEKKDLASPLYRALKKNTFVDPIVIWGARFQSQSAY